MLNKMAYLLTENSNYSQRDTLLICDAASIYRRYTFDLHLTILQPDASSQTPPNAEVVRGVRKIVSCVETLATGMFTDTSVRDGSKSEKIQI